MLPPGLPELTLGWDILQWGSDYLAQPDGFNKGDRWIYTPEQARFILWYYAIDEYGRFLYNRALLGRPKGWGKSPLVAAIAATELLGPVLFSHFDNEGNPVGQQHPTPRVQLAAISEAQVENTFEPLREMLAYGPASSEYEIDIMLSRIDRCDFYSGVIERVTSSFRSREGNRPTFVILDETHLWVPAEKGPELASTLRRGLGKTGGRSIETTNAPVPGEGSVAEESYLYAEQILGGLASNDKFLFDSTEVHVEDIYDRETCFPGLVKAYGDARWIDLERIWAEINDPATKEYDSRRFYFNERVQNYSQWIKVAAWDKCKDVDVRPLDANNDKYVLGFKGAVRNGAASLVACRLSDSALFVLGLWEKPLDASPEWEVPFLEVDARVRKWMGRPGFCWLGADPHQWQDIVGRWSLDFPDQVEEFWISQKMKYAKAVEQFETAVLTGRVKHPGDANLTRHVMNAHTEEIPQGYIIRMETPYSKRYISGAHAAVIAYEYAQVAIEAGCLNDTDNSLYSF